ncbi:hypothetical protein ES705_42763 [subsurface metagenome]
MSLLDGVVTSCYDGSCLMKKAKQRYDKKYRVTRIFLADYLMLKRIAFRAGISMSEALHQAFLSPIKAIKPVSPVKAVNPVSPIKAINPIGAIASGGGIPALSINLKGVCYD